MTKGKTKQTNYKILSMKLHLFVLKSIFNNLYPEFLVFKIKITKDNNAEIISRAIKYFAGQKTKDSEDFIASFNLIDNGKINVENSKYAMYLVKKMRKLPKQGVLNRNDILKVVNEELLDKEFKINNEYFIVVLLALVYAGYANLVLKNLTITASNMDKLMSLKNLDIYDFKYLAKPKEAAVAELKRLLEVLGFPPGMAVNNKELDKGLDRILAKTTEIAKLAVEYKNFINNEPTLWGELLFPEHIKII